MLEYACYLRLCRFAISLCYRLLLLNNVYIFYFTPHGQCDKQTNKQINGQTDKKRNTAKHKQNTQIVNYLISSFTET